jgi:hypothetical protein
LAVLLRSGAPMQRARSLVIPAGRFQPQTGFWRRRLRRRQANPASPLKILAFCPRRAAPCLVSPATSRRGSVQTW